MSALFFRASRKKSNTYGAYRQIVKSGDTSMDICRDADDVIFIQEGTTAIRIDCDKKTGVFRIQIN